MGIKTGILVTALGGTLIAAAATSWLGGGSITEGIELITEQDAQIEIFKTNEDKLITQLKATTQSIQNLQNQIVAKNKQIAELIAAGEGHTEQVAELQAQVDSLTEQLAMKTTELEALNKQIADGNIDLESDAFFIKAQMERLIGEIETANADAERLQETVNEFADVTTSNTEAVDNAIAEAVAAMSGVPVTPETPTEPEAEPEPEYEIFNMISDTPKHYDNSRLTITKQDLDFDGVINLVVTAQSTHPTDVYLDGVKIGTVDGGEIDLGIFASLDGKVLKLVSGNNVREMKLVNK